jgi:5-methyltetrahydropteroyltriglutamate--homocysteine methyltransferase
MLTAHEKGELRDSAALAARVCTAVAEVVRQQHDAGVDVLNDGEMGKFNYATYVKNRLTGFEGAEERALLAGVADIQDYPAYARRQALPSRTIPACTGPIIYKDTEAVQRDITNFRAALHGVQPEDTFLSAASPGVIALFLPNHY